MSEKYSFKLNDSPHPSTWKGVIWGGFGAIAAAIRLGLADVAGAIREGRA